MRQLRRRQFVIASGLLLAAPLAAKAQQVVKVYRIGLFHVGVDHVPPSLEPLKKELKALGYMEGTNIHLDWRNLPDEEAAREVAKEFVRNRVNLIVAFENHTIRAAKAATSELPVVFLHATDPVEAGFVKSMSHPAGNLTGFAGTSPRSGCSYSRRSFLHCAASSSSSTPGTPWHRGIWESTGGPPQS